MLLSPPNEPEREGDGAIPAGHTAPVVRVLVDAARETARHYRKSFAAALLAGALIPLLLLTDTGEAWERRSQDLRFLLRGPRPTNARIVIVAVDGKSVQAWSNAPMASWTHQLGDVITNSRKAGATVAGLDILPTISMDEYLKNLGVGVTPDAHLATAIQKASDELEEGFVVLAQQRAQGGYTAGPAAFLASLPELEENIAFADLPPSPDGVVREALRSIVPPGADPVAEREWSFAALIARRLDPAAQASTASPPVMRVPPGGFFDTFWINYTGTEFPTISAVDLAEGTLTPEEVAKLKGSAVLIGATLPDLGDRHLGPAGVVYSGVKLHAQALATLLDNRPLRRSPRAAEALLTLALGLLGAFLAAALPFGRAGLTAGALSVFAIGLSILGFVRADLLLPLVGPVLAVTAPWAAFHLARSMEEARRRREVEGTFGRMVSTEIRDYLLATPTHLRLGGARREVTCLFLDIRGSTPYAQDRDPVAVMEELNDFFAAIVPVVDRHQGHLYRYTGDGFLAVFGAPRPLIDHAGAATAAAVELVQQVRKNNEKRVQNGLEEWRVGCAVHSGPVAFGLLGMDERAEVNVIGDTVNLCAKLEGLNKLNDRSDVIVSGTASAASAAAAASALSPWNAPSGSILLETRDLCVGDRTAPTRIHFLHILPVPGAPVSQPVGLPSELLETRS